MSGGMCGELRLMTWARPIDSVRNSEVAAMLTELGQRGYTIQEQSDENSVSRNDTDTDSDPDSGRSRK